MAVLLALLVRIADILRAERFTPAEQLLIRTPFSVYFGWITVAAIAQCDGISGEHRLERIRYS